MCLAGIYFKDAIVEGTQQAFLASLVAYLPLLLLCFKARLFERVSDWFQVMLFLFLFVYSMLLGAMCPHYWEVALPAFALVAVFLLLVVRLKRRHPMKRAVLIVALINVFVGAISASRVVSDWMRVADGSVLTEEAFKENLRQRRQVNDGADLSE